MSPEDRIPLRIEVRPTAGGTIRVVVTQKDRPFLLRSFLDALRGMGLSVRRLEHPVLAAIRRGGRRILRPAREDDVLRISRIVCEAVPAGETAPAPRTVIRRLAAVFREVARATDGFERTKERMRRAAEDLLRLPARTPRRRAERSEAVALLQWLLDGHFVLLGFAEEPRKPIAKFVEIEKSDEETPVYRAGRMDLVRVARPAGGTVVFRGLFADRAERAAKARVPILRRKYEWIRKRLGLVPNSHDDHALRRLFEGYPVDLLFATKASDLLEELALSLSGPGEEGVRMAFRRDPVRRGLSLTVVVEESAFHRPLADKIARRVARRIPCGTPEVRFHLDATSRTARMHFFFPTEARLTPKVLHALRREIAEVAKRWDRAYEEALAAALGERRGLELARRYAGAFPESYRVLVAPRLAVRDTEDLEALAASGGRMHLAWGENREGMSFLKIYRTGERIPLTEIAPPVADHGLRILTETSYELATKPERTFLHILEVVRADTNEPVATNAPEGARLLASLRAAFAGAGSDAFSALVLRAGLAPEETEVVRAVAEYIRQIGTPYARGTVAATFLAHPAFVRGLLDLFDYRFGPRRDAKKEAEAARALDRYLVGVSVLHEDRILRLARAVLDATVRTNAFLPGRRAVAFKLATDRLEVLPPPRPYREIFVHGPEVMGTHIRFGPVARGGIRHSDRPDDFRTEILDLALTQTIKNAHIVPTGAKGGFVLRKNLSVEEGYRIFVGTLLDLTDNIAGGRVVRPPGVSRDGDDPYLVVAADKGTARLSDTANELAAARRFWLGDAFASGGSNGYDHKALGITAKGAWQAALRHLRELGIPEEETTVVGIGDMSGDVFGNGMLLSKKIRLVAAFDHRHIFVDPDPDPEASWRERRRLFLLPRSSWADYRGLSKGGFVVPRQAKVVRLSPEARRVLGVTETTLDGEALVRAVLRAPATLLYNGGIGTYVKSRDESNAEVGDPANDAVRVDAEDLRVRIVVEGGNLGFTQKARIAFARRGGRIHTDALDNAAGVTLSDREVNLKILLGPRRDRARIVRRATGSVVAATIRDVSDQFLAVSLDLARAAEDSEPFVRLLGDLLRRGVLDRRRHELPDAEELADRRARGESFFAPELAVLLAGAKIDYANRLLESPLLSEPALLSEAEAYFPPEAKATRRALSRFPLRRALLAARLASRLVNRHGATLLIRMTTDTGLAASRVTEALLHAERILALGEIEPALDRLDARAARPAGAKGTNAAAAVREVRLALAERCEEVAVWLIRAVGNLRARLGALPPYDGLLERIERDAARLLPQEERRHFAARVSELRAAGVPEALARRIAATRYLRSFLDAVRIAERMRIPFERAARVLFAVGEELGYPALLARLEELARSGPGMGTAVRLVTFDLRRARRRIAERVLSLSGGWDAFVAGRPRSYATIRSLAERIARGEVRDLASFVTLAHQIDNLARV